MKYSIVGAGLVGKTLAGIFATQGMRALIANSRGPESLAEIAAELGPHIIPATVDRALDADIIFFAVGFLHFKEVAAKRPDWTGKIVIDVTNAFMLPAEIQESELHGRLSSEVNAERVPGAKLVKAFNQLPMRALIAPLPDSTGRRVVFVASDYEDASAEVSQARMTFEQSGHLRLNDIPQQSSAVSLVRKLPPAVTETGRNRIRLVDDHLGYEWPP
jgi:8-hydroxy-5-deazaflavin:NADPH oxidoreductase